MKRIIAVLLLVCMLIACRPTPEKEIVSHKDADEMLEKAELNGSAPDAPIRGQYGIPEKLESVTNEGNGHFIVKIDARVEVPDVNALPILRVERDTFSQETVTAVFDRLCKGRTLYRTGSSFMTKARIAEEIVRIEEELNDASLEEDVRAVMQSRIAALKEQYPSAPDGQDERMISDGTMYSYPVTIIDGEPEVLRFGLSLQTDDALPTQHFSVIITDPDNPNTTEGGRDAQKYGRISFLDERSRAGTDERQTKVPIRDVNDPTELSDYPQVSYLPMQAAADAERFFREIGHAEIVPDAVTLVFDSTNTAYGYQIMCVRTCGDVRGTCMQAGFATEAASDERYAPEWMYESIKILIDEQGIYRLTWEAPIRVTETIREAVRLTPFSEITDRFQRQMWTENSVWVTLDPSRTSGDENGFYTSDLRFEVTRITLSLQRVMEPNRFDTGMLVPVWNFWGTKHITETSLKTGEQRTDSVTGSGSFLSINAIDGSVIDPWKGY